jgi:preprotein translocase subunit YajC
MTIPGQNEYNIKWISKLSIVLIVFFLFFVPRPLQAQKKLGLQLIDNKSNKNYIFCTEEIIKINFIDNNKIRKIKGKLLVLNDQEISINKTVIRIDHITKVKIKNNSISRGVRRALGGVVLVPTGIALMFLGFQGDAGITGILGTIILGSGIYQFVEGIKILRYNPGKIDYIDRRLIAIVINPLVVDKIK